MNPQNQHFASPKQPFLAPVNAKHDPRLDLSQAFAILSASELREIGRFFPSKSEPVAKFELSEETLLRLRNLRKFRSFSAKRQTTDDSCSPTT